MGAVYLATHLGTERYVALKLITPQFMRNEEFVERFKREAFARFAQETHNHFLAEIRRQKRNARGD